MPIPRSNPTEIAKIMRPAWTSREASRLIRAAIGTPTITGPCIARAFFNVDELHVALVRGNRSTDPLEFGDNGPRLRSLAHDGVARLAHETLERVRREFLIVEDQDDWRTQGCSRRGHDSTE